MVEAVASQYCVYVVPVLKVGYFARSAGAHNVDRGGNRAVVRKVNVSYLGNVVAYAVVVGGVLAECKRKFNLFVAVGNVNVN